MTGFVPIDSQLCEDTRFLMNGRLEEGLLCFYYMCLGKVGDRFLDVREFMNRIM